MCLVRRASRLTPTCDARRCRVSSAQCAALLTTRSRRAMLRSPLSPPPIFLLAAPIFSPLLSPLLSTSPTRPCVRSPSCPPCSPLPPAPSSFPFLSLPSFSLLCPLRFPFPSPAPPLLTHHWCCLSALPPPAPHLCCLASFPCPHSSPPTPPLLSASSTAPSSPT